MSNFINNLKETLNMNINKYLKPNNKYVIATIMALLMLYSSIYAPKLPGYAFYILDNILVKFLLIFMLLYINLNAEPFVAIISAAFILILIFTLNSLKSSNETMASITGIPNEGVPPYVYSICGIPHNAKMHKYPIINEADNINSDIYDDTDVAGGDTGGVTGVSCSPDVTDVSDAEMKSLCLQLKNQKQDPTQPFINELITAEQSCSYANHQKNFNYPKVKCTDDISGNEKIYSKLAPLDH